MKRNHPSGNASNATGANGRYDTYTSGFVLFDAGKVREIEIS